jgi:hypothetical protein
MVAPVVQHQLLGAAPLEPLCLQGIAVGAHRGCRQRLRVAAVEQSGAMHRAWQRPRLTGDGAQVLQATPIQAPSLQPGMRTPAGFSARRRMRSVHIQRTHKYAARRPCCLRPHSSHTLVRTRRRITLLCSTSSAYTAARSLYTPGAATCGRQCGAMVDADLLLLQRVAMTPHDGRRDVASPVTGRRVAGPVRAALPAPPVLLV